MREGELPDGQERPRNDRGLLPEREVQARTLRCRDARAVGLDEALVGGERAEHQPDGGAYACTVQTEEGKSDERPGDRSGDDTREVFFPVFGHGRRLCIVTHVTPPTIKNTPLFTM